MKITKCLLMVPLVVLLCSAIGDNLEINDKTPVWKVLQYFGEPAPNHMPDTQVKGYSVAVGEQIVLYGHGQQVKQQSKHFVCTSCHNIQKEDPDLGNPDPQARLEFVAERNIPFLQGTTLYGVVNRTSFYNDDYEKKYGDLVYPARKNLREAIQLCAVECSQGRRLNDWELESVLGYLWTLQLTMGDLNMSESDMAAVQSASSPARNSTNAGVISSIQKYYLTASPAHFIDPPSDRKTGNGLKGNPDNGRKIYELSCLHCHEKERYSFFNLDNSTATFCYLDKHFSKYSHASIYQVARYGTSPLPGKRAYMPQYPVEKMSEQQLADLRAYIEQEGGK